MDGVFASGPLGCADPRWVKRIITPAVRAIFNAQRKKNGPLKKKKTPSRLDGVGEMKGKGGGRFASFFNGWIRWALGLLRALYQRRFQYVGEHRE